MKLYSLFIIGIFALAICPGKTNLYQIQITPVNESKTFQMKVGQTQTFSIIAFKDKEKSDIKVTRLWWQFNRVLLKKIAQDKTSITLKAEKPGVSKLSISCIIEFLSYDDSITIIIKP